MSRVAFSGVLLVLGAWFTTLGACGRTLPGLEDEYGSGAYGDDTGTTGGTDGARGGSSARGGTGGSLSTGGSVNTGGSVGAFGGSGNNANVGGSTIGGRGQGRGGRGGGVSTGGTAGNVATGGDGNSTSTGGTTTTGGSGGSAQAGAGALPPDSIVCGDVVCDATSSICCNRRTQPSYCTDIGGQCPGVTLECSGRSACREGEVCCFHDRRSVCASTCNVNVGSPGNPPTIILCESSADCAADQTCVVAPRGIPYCGDNL